MPSPPRHPHARLRARRRGPPRAGFDSGAIVGAIVLAAAALVVAIVVWGGAGSSPAPPPDLPQVEEPLGTHLQELMDEVSP